MNATAHKLTKSARTDASSSDNWHTPQVVFDCVRKYAPIGLDPCTDETNPAGARKFLAIRGGLEMQWGRRLRRGEVIWLNPPFSTKGWWLQKAVAEAADWPVFVLCRASHTARWWDAMMFESDVVMYWKKRLHFIDPAAKRTAAAPFDAAIFGLNVSYKRCVNAFGQYARVEVCRG